VRPFLKPGLRRVWRDDTTLQFGLDPDRAVVVTDLEPSIARFIDDLTGATDLTDTLARAQADGVDGETAANVLRVLADAGVLDDADADAAPLRSLSPIERERLAPDLAARALISTEPGNGLRALRVRRNATVRVSSSSRVGAAVATLLASSGVGHLVLTDQRPAVGTDIGPAGLRPSDVGQPRTLGMRRVLTELAPSTRLTQRTTHRPDVVVIAADDEPDRAAAIELVRDGIPHLIVGVRETVGVVGPFVIPGSTACLHCLDLHRTDLDPGWPGLLAQASAAGTADSVEVNLATLVASLAVLHVLSYLDGGEPPSVNGTLSAGLPDATIRRRSWLPHQQCGCTWESLARPDDPPDPGSQ
jgi:bacteriocin biosynthesis cyclodehydratase domain-containing protein